MRFGEGILPPRAVEIIDAHPLLIAATGVLSICLLLILTIDPWVAWTVRDEASRETRQFFRSITDLGLAGPFIISALVVFLASRGAFLAALPNRIAYAYHRASEMALYVLVTMILSGIAVQVLKALFGRLRPKHLLKDDTYGFAFASAEWSTTSFPSGHSQAIFSAMTALTILFPRFWYVFMPFAALIAISRVMVSAHFPSDIIAGSALGALGALLVKRWWFMHLNGPAFPAASLPGETVRGETAGAMSRPSRVRET